jgi:hypothetical protein
MIQEKSLLEAMTAMSDSILALTRFMQALTKFVKLHKLGKAEFEMYPAPQFYEFRGYDFGGFRLYDSQGKDIMYFAFYTDGSADGENFKVEEDAKMDCSWNIALHKILKTLGVLNVSKLSSEKIAKAVEALDQ